MMKDFVAIDFETANHNKTSICSVGVVIVRDGVVQEEFYHLIKPAPNFYASWATKCHGLTAIDTDEARIFPEVWEEIAPRIVGLPLVAHNKSFDENCLVATLEHYCMKNPRYEFHCTLAAARRLFPYLENRQLHTVSEHIGFHLDNHHHALADAQACAAIALKIL